ncbi:chromosome partitioning protein ParA [Vibrio sp. LaRot3]|uniref:chromosome partitioning protein ParA n=1 Tax=Vibrio sp. LaRot3 TaxID=2998829 RepID=UPI0022CE363E|nr:chromosome partitioning protein ParA [Vibrio sp. LaRot3]MDA0147604.1 chromosome partitioning protein ParA [Vibrio sp. LaRot3]
MMPATHTEIEQIFLAAEAKQCRSLCVTACDSGDGVTSVATALTERYLLAGRSVLLVDLNLFNSGFNDLAIDLESDSENHTFGHPSAKVTWLEQQSSKQVFTGIATPSTPSELVQYSDPQCLAKYIEDWLQSYDRIVIDTSPLLKVNRGNIPAQAVAQACQFVLLVVLATHTTHNQLEQAKQLLEAHQTHLIGSVLNSVHQPTLASEISRQIKRLPLVPNRIKQKWIDKLHQMPLLLQRA